MGKFVVLRTELGAGNRTSTPQNQTPKIPALRMLTVVHGSTVSAGEWLPITPQDVENAIGRAAAASPRFRRLLAEQLPQRLGIDLVHASMYEWFAITIAQHWSRGELTGFGGEIEEALQAACGELLNSCISI